MININIKCLTDSIRWLQFSFVKLRIGDQKCFQIKVLFFAGFTLFALRRWRDHNGPTRSQDDLSGRRCLFYEIWSSRQHTEYYLENLQNRRVILEYRLNHLTNGNHYFNSPRDFREIADNFTDTLTTLSFTLYSY